MVWRHPPSTIQIGKPIFILFQSYFFLKEDRRRRGLLNLSSSPGTGAGKKKKTHHIYGGRGSEGLHSTRALASGQDPRGEAVGLPGGPRGVVEAHKHGRGRPGPPASRRGRRTTASCGLHSRGGSGSGVCVAAVAGGSAEVERRGALSRKLGPPETPPQRGHWAPRLRGVSGAKAGASEGPTGRRRGPHLSFRIFLGLSPRR